MDKKHLNICLKVNRIVYILYIISIVVCSASGTVDGNMIIGFIAISLFPICVGKVIKTNGSLWYVLAGIFGILFCLIFLPMLLNAVLSMEVIVILFFVHNFYNAYVFVSICKDSEIRAAISQS